MTHSFGPAGPCDVCGSDKIITVLKDEYSGRFVKQLCHKCMSKADCVLFRGRDRHIEAVRKWIQSGLSDDHHPDQFFIEHPLLEWRSSIVIGFLAGVLVGWLL